MQMHHVEGRKLVPLKQESNYTTNFLKCVLKAKQWKDVGFRHEQGNWLQKNSSFLIDGSMDFVVVIAFHLKGRLTPHKKITNWTKKRHWNVTWEVPSWTTERDIQSCRSSKFGWDCTLFCDDMMLRPTTKQDWKKFGALVAHQG